MPWEDRAGSHTTADHIAVLDRARMQVSDGHRHGAPILVRAYPRSAVPGAGLLRSVACPSAESLRGPVLHCL
ncbi:hypothetical protein [Plantactinospora soyae]|uniref:Uncharacterized protein n=1 Tax=Plantactinospora soyae TaxID=1544732 RepID=A0A927R020_9ACTN|nr:hypothetical protein [Plantactinospora soyae]MBE1491055.1 hypothetical protein [Plantactinospora soyae]